MDRIGTLLFDSSVSALVLDHRWVIGQYNRDLIGKLQTSKSSFESKAILRMIFHCVLKFYCDFFFQKMDIRSFYRNTKLTC